LLEPGAILGGQFESVLIAPVRFQMPFEPRFVVFQQRLVSEGTFSIWPALSVHLQQSHIHSQLDLFAPILALEPSHLDLAWLVGPFVQYMRNVKAHYSDYGLR
jgi:hypothetical protein